MSTKIFVAVVLRSLTKYNKFAQFLTNLSEEKTMIDNQGLALYQVETVRRIEINVERIGIWTLIFTNAFFVTYFLAKLLQVL